MGRFRERFDHHYARSSAARGVRDRHAARLVETPPVRHEVVREVREVRVESTPIQEVLREVHVEAAPMPWARLVIVAGAVSLVVSVIARLI